MERRLNVRHKARTKVHIRTEGKTARLCQAVNLSATGVAVITEEMGLRTGMICELSFAVNLGAVVKIHKRYARVVYVKNGITGFMMEQFGATITNINGGKK